MSTSVEQLHSWFLEGLDMGATHMIVKTDWFDHEDYPVYVLPDENVREISHKNQDRTVEVYAMHIPWEVQAKEFRAFHYESK